MYTNSSIPTRNRALTHISLRRALRALSAQLTNLVHRLHPQISPLLHPEYSIFQRRLSHARQRVQLVWKELWRVALGGGVMGLGRRRRVAGFESRKVEHVAFHVPPQFLDCCGTNPPQFHHIVPVKVSRLTFFVNYLENG
jgi:fumarate hydratase class II